MRSSDEDARLRVAHNGQHAARDRTEQRNSNLVHFTNSSVLRKSFRFLKLQGKTSLSTKKQVASSTIKSFNSGDMDNTSYGK